MSPDWTWAAWRCLSLWPVATMAAIAGWNSVPRSVSPYSTEGGEGELLRLTMAKYFPIVDKRPSPASRSETRSDRIVSIEFAGPVTAFAKLNCVIGLKHFTDFLTLVKLDGRWQIISKVFHFDLQSK